MPNVTAYAKRKTITLTTKGRKSGQPRSVKIWFVVEAPDAIVVQHVNGPIAQWYRNLEHDGAVTVDFGDGPIAGRAEPITDPAGIDSVVRRIRAKHWLAGRLIQFLGRNSPSVAARIRLVES